MKKVMTIIILIVLIVLGIIFVPKIFTNKEKDNKELSTTEEIIESDDLFGKYYTKANKVLKEMTLEEKIGQLFLVSYDTNYAPRWIRDYNVGGFLFFAKDFNGKTKEMVKKEIAGLQDLSPNHLIIAVDEEGGYVTRVSRYTNFRDSKFLSPKAYYEEGGYELLEKTEQEKAQLLLSLGINLNLAPVADISTNEDDFIYIRSFGRNAQETSDYIRHMINYANKEGISSSLKHFPGYGNNVDTHNGVAIDNRSYEEISTNDYLPFIAGIEEKVPTILVSHNIVKCLDETYPATLSENVIKELREKLNFSGIIITDDLAMDAVKEFVESKNAATLAIKAGDDLIITSDFEEMYAEVLKAVQDGNISEETIDTAVRRILAYKLAYKM